MRFDSVTSIASPLRAQGMRTAKPANALLWVLQGLLAALFLFAGVAKLTMPIQTLASLSGLPGMFMQFIAIAEVVGALGLTLPGLLRIRPSLTPLAAAGLLIIMIGAIIVTITRQGIAPAIFPIFVGGLLTLVIRFRWGHVPRRYPSAVTSSGLSRLQPQ